MDPRSPLSALKELLTLAKEAGEKGELASKALDLLAKGVGKIEIGGVTSKASEVGLQEAVERLNKLDQEVTQLRIDRLGRER